MKFGKLISNGKIKKNKQTLIKNAQVAVLTSDKVNFRAKKVIRNKYNDKIIIQENIMVLNVYVLIDRVSNT